MQKAINRPALFGRSISQAIRGFIQELPEAEFQFRTENSELKVEIISTEGREELEILVDGEIVYFQFGGPEGPAMDNLIRLSTMEGYAVIFCIQFCIQELLQGG